jgi:DNA-binding transcriptional ArsR family regulator
MSIDRETFENASEDELADLSVPDEVLGFLAAHDDRAFKAREIASQTDLDEGAVSTALSRLKDRGLVEHKATYWAVTDDTERLEGYSGYERATALFNDQLGTEDTDAWRDHAPSESHPSVDDETEQ